MIYGKVYSLVMRVSHRFNWHYLSVCYPDGDTLLRCKWCGVSSLVRRRATATAERSIVLTVTLLLLGAVANAQEPQPTPCVENCVTITREAAIAAVETAKERDALKVQLTAEKQAVEDMRKELNEMRLKFAAISGELAGVKQFAVRDAALIEYLVKNQRSKQNGLINIKLGGN